MKKILIIVLFLALMFPLLGQNISRDTLIAKRGMICKLNFVYRDSIINFFTLTESRFSDTDSGTYHKYPVDGDKFMKILKYGYDTLTFPTWEAVLDTLSNYLSSTNFIDSTIIRGIINDVKIDSSYVLMSDTLDVIETKYHLNDTLQYYPKKAINLYKTIPVTSRNISVNYGVAMTNPGYKFNAFAWYDSPTGRVYNGMTEPDTTLTGFTCTVNSPQGYLFYEAMDSSGFLSEESGWTEIDPQYSSDSLFIKTGVRSWNSSLAKTIDTADTTYWGRAETDPVFSASLASDITASDTTRWGVDNSTPNISTSGYILKNTNDTIKNSAIFEDATGKIGIGTATPSNAFVVEKNMVAPTIIIHNTGGGGGSGYRFIDDVGSADWTFKATTTGGFKIRDNLAAVDNLIIEKGGIANSLYISATGGNIGFGTSTPLSKLAVIGSIATNLNMFNYVDSDRDKNRTTIAAATDTSSFHFSFSPTGNGTLHLTDKAGATQLLSDSTLLTVPKIKTTQISAALTDGTPTDTEIDTATGLTPATAGAGWECWIKDNNGSGLVYRIYSDGSGWYWFVTTLAL
jgi:hypothetical protein